jgi:hypothetical protein
VDPDPGGPKTCESGGSGFGSGSATLLSRNERVFEELEACQPVTTLLDNGVCILIIFLLRMHTTLSLTTTRERVSSQSTTDTEGTRWQNTAAAIYQTTSKRNSATDGASAKKLLAKIRTFFIWISIILLSKYLTVL